MTSVRSALFIALLLTNTITILQFSSSLVIARLLSPKEIGIYSIAAAIVSIAQLFRNVGVANYLVSEKELTHDKIRAAFGVQLVMSWILALLVFLSSGFVADFYHEEGVRRVMTISSISFLLAPFGGVTVTLLLREMRHLERAVVDIASTLVHVGLSVSLAYAGHGYMSLAWAALGNTVTTVFVGALFRPSGMPWLPDFREARNVLSFSIPTAGADILRYLRSITPELVVGRAIGLEAVAFLSRASGMIGLFNSVLGQAISRVAFSYFPHEHRSGSNLKALFLKALDYLCVTSLPFFATLAVMADPVIRILFGEQWVESILLVQILSIAAMVITPFSITSMVLNATGHAKSILRIEVIVFAFTVALIVPAASIRNEAVAAALTAVALIYGFVCFRQVRNVLDVRLPELLLAFGRAVSVAIATVVLPIGVMLFYITDKPWHVIVAGGIGATLGWILSVYLSRHPIHYEITKLFTYASGRIGVLVRRQQNKQHPDEK